MFDLSFEAGGTSALATIPAPVFRFALRTEAEGGRSNPEWKNVADGASYLSIPNSLLIVDLALRADSVAGLLISQLPDLVIAHAEVVGDLVDDGEADLFA
jgi:hypothetical protein